MDSNIDYSNIPKHIGIIMDGNGRWAKKRFLGKANGHRAGAKTLKKLNADAEDIGIKYLTVYAFSTENWKRSESEVESLMKLLREYVQQYIDDSENNNMKISSIGDITRLDKVLQEKILYLSEITKDKTGLNIIIALNYGGRDEIIRATKKMFEELIRTNTNVNNINEDIFEKYLDTYKTPDPELIIRTSGEIRLSNFLLWQSAYSEFYFSDKLWPDFKKSDLLDAILSYQQRKRNFGGR